MLAGINGTIYDLLRCMPSLFLCSFRWFSFAKLGYASCKNQMRKAMLIGA
jgi:hypothetical protein